MYEVEGKTAVVTGAASGIGRGMARAFAAAGMSVVLADVELDRLEKAVAELRQEGHSAIGVPTDVTDGDQVRALADAALAEFGAVHVVANNAGVGTGGAIEELALDDWRWTFDVNLWGVIHGLRTFLPILKAQGEGHLSATSSIAGLVGGPVLGAYHASKHAVVGLMDSLRVELEQVGSPVRASVLCPGSVDTDVARSDRNRPATASAPPPRSDRTERFWEDLTEQLAEGLHPDQVGEIMLDAIRRERFWVLTHPAETMEMLERRIEAIGRDNA